MCIRDRLLLHWPRPQRGDGQEAHVGSRRPAPVGPRLGRSSPRLAQRRLLRADDSGSSPAHRDGLAAVAGEPAGADPEARVAEGFRNQSGRARADLTPMPTTQAPGRASAAEDAAALRAEIRDLYDEVADLLDDDRVEELPNHFTDDCLY